MSSQEGESSTAADAFYFCAKLEKFFVNHFVATVDVVETIDLGSALGF